jgi:hypothetical protein
LGTLDAPENVYWALPLAPLAGVNCTVTEDALMVVATLIVHPAAARLEHEIEPLPDPEAGVKVTWVAGLTEPPMMV